MGSTVSTPNLDENNNNNTNSTKFLNGTAAGKEHREFICAISGCTKRYRNSNSLSHHRRSAHRFNNNAIITPKPTADERFVTTHLFESMIKKKFFFLK